MVDIVDIKEVLFTDVDKVIVQAELDDGRIIEVCVEAYPLYGEEKINFRDDKKMASLIAWLLRMEIIPMIRS